MFKLMPARADEATPSARIPERDMLINAMRTILEDAHCATFMRFEAHDAEARLRTATRFVDGIITPALSRARGQ